MIKKTNPCILLIKYIRNKQAIWAVTLLLILSAFPLTASPRNIDSQGNAMQPATITGSVTDQDNSPLAGVYVVIEGTNTGVITDVKRNALADCWQRPAGGAPRCPLCRDYQRHQPQQHQEH